MGNPIAFVDPLGLTPTLVKVTTNGVTQTGYVNPADNRTYLNYNNGNYSGRPSEGAIVDFGDGRVYNVVKEAGAPGGVGGEKTTGKPSRGGDGGGGITIAYGTQIVELRGGWMARYEVGDPNVPGYHDHMHVYKNDYSQVYGQRDDGAPKDKPKGGTRPPKKVLEDLKNKTGWDWNAKEKDWLSKIKVELRFQTCFEITYPDGSVAYIPRYSMFSSPSSSDFISYYFGSTVPVPSGGMNTFPMIPIPGGSVPIPNFSLPKIPVPSFSWFSFAFSY